MRDASFLLYAPQLKHHFVPIDSSQADISTTIFALKQSSCINGSSDQINGDVHGGLVNSVLLVSGGQLLDSDVELFVEGDVPVIPSKVAHCSAEVGIHSGNRQSFRLPRSLFPQH